MSAWDAVLQGFRDDVAQMRPSQLVLLVATSAGLEDIARSDYDACDMTTWLVRESVAERIGELLEVAMNALDDLLSPVLTISTAHLGPEELDALERQLADLRANPEVGMIVDAGELDAGEFAEEPCVGVYVDFQGAERWCLPGAEGCALRGCPSGHPPSGGW